MLLVLILAGLGSGCGTGWKMDYGKPAAQFLQADLASQGEAFVGKKITVKGTVAKVDVSDPKTAWIHLSGGIQCNLGKFKALAESCKIRNPLVQALAFKIIIDNVHTIKVCPSKHLSLPCFISTLKVTWWRPRQAIRIEWSVFQNRFNLIMTHMVDTLGWIGTLLLGICGFPQLIKSYREGHSYGISWLFILAWFFGEVFLLVYIVSESKGMILSLNYALNLVFAGGILYYKLFPRKGDSPSEPNV